MLPFVPALKLGVAVTGNGVLEELHPFKVAVTV
jgi:hypothetical protein